MTCLLPCLWVVLVISFVWFAVVMLIYFGCMLVVIVYFGCLVGMWVDVLFLGVLVSLIELCWV